MAHTVIINIHFFVIVILLALLWVVYYSKNINFEMLINFYMVVIATVYNKWFYSASDFTSIFSEDGHWKVQLKYQFIFIIY